MANFGPLSNTDIREGFSCWSVMFRTFPTLVLIPRAEGGFKYEDGFPNSENMLGTGM